MPFSSANSLLRQLRGKESISDECRLSADPAGSLLWDYFLSPPPDPVSKDSAREFLRQKGDGIVMLEDYAVGIGRDVDPISYHDLWQAYRKLKMPHSKTFEEFNGNYLGNGGNANLWEGYLLHLQEIEEKGTRSLNEVEKQQCKDAEWLFRTREEKEWGEDGDNTWYYEYYNSINTQLMLLREEQHAKEEQEEEEQERRDDESVEVGANESSNSGPSDGPETSGVEHENPTEDQQVAGKRAREADEDDDAGDVSDELSNPTLKRQKLEQEPEQQMEVIEVSDSSTVDSEDEEDEEEADESTLVDSGIGIGEPTKATGTKADPIDISSDPVDDSEQDEHYMNEDKDDDADPDICFEEFAKGGFRVLMGRYCPPWEG
ncbi:MAG: hypothetical protein Q9218_004896 [Villophora microphyllina]